MAYCNKCGKRIVWDRFQGKFIPMNENGTSHFETCVPDPEYMKKYKRIMGEPVRKDPVQIGENEFIN